METKQSQIRTAVYKAIAYLSSENPEAKQAKARLRHSAGLEPGEDPELFGWFLTRVPEGLQGKGGGLSKEELAIYTALLLYPNGPKPPRKADRQEAAADAEDAPADDAGGGKWQDYRAHSIARAAKAAGIRHERLAAVESAGSIREAVPPLRALLQLLKDKGQLVDYALLAADLYEWQWDSARTCRAWEREYA